MIKQLEQAIRKAEMLPEEDQEAIAALIEAELADDAKWEKRFSETEGTLLKIAERAKRQYEQGLCEEL